MKKISSAVVFYTVLLFSVFTISVNAFDIARYLATRYVFQPVSDFTVDNKTFVDGNVVLSGTMIKGSNCVFKSVSAYLSYNGNFRTLREVTFTETTHAVSRSEGAQVWGDWLIKVGDFDTLELYSLHDCDGTYKTTKLIELEL